MERQTRDIAFHGTGPATAPATWGQRYMWRNFQEWSDDTARYNQVCEVGVPDGLTVDGVLEEIREIVVCHESLRTHLYLEEGRLRQRLLPNGVISVDLVLLAERRDRTFEALVRDERERLSSRGFDATNDTPFRSTVIVLDGVPDRVILCLPHTAADLHSLRILRGELGDRLTARAAGRPAPAAPRARQPIEQAEFEASPAGRRIGERSRAYLERTVAALPSVPFVAVPEPSLPTIYWKGEMRSRAAALAAGALGARYQASTASVLLTATVAVLSRVTRTPACALWLLVGNRSSPDLRHSVGNILQKIPILIETSNSCFGELLKRVWAVSQRAYRHGQFAPEDVDGFRGRVSFLYNDRREDVNYHNRLITAVTPDEVQSARTETVFNLGAATRMREPVSIDIGTLEDAILFTVTLGECFIPRSAIWPFLATIETLIIELMAREVSLDEIDGFLRS